MRKRLLFARQSFPALLVCAAVSLGQTPPGTEKEDPAERARDTESPSLEEARLRQQAHPSAPQLQGPRPPAIPPGYRALSWKEGRTIVRKISWTDDEEGLTPDCSHLVHTLYARAGYVYPYASSTALYRGSPDFVRVPAPQPGDLIVWPGHVGIVVNPADHSFFSSVSAGAQTRDYTSPYWRARGHARFYRYLRRTAKKAG